MSRPAPAEPSRPGDASRIAASRVPRYDDVAVGFHWLIALLIIGQLAAGKYMTGLGEADALRFVLTQWHKTFGILVLLAATARLAWRLTHSPPPDPESVPAWQARAAGIAHVALYALMIAIPLTGWALVSVSPLDVKTYLFDVIPWPHLPLPVAHTEANEHRVAEWHEIAGNLLILILVVHVGAALKHHVVDKDTVLVRMLPTWSRSWNAKLAAFGVAVAASGTALYLYADAGDEAALLAAGASEVGFVAGVTGDATPGTFPASEVVATLDENDPGASRIEARVATAGVTSPNAQMAGSLPDADWFDSATHPEATFASGAVRRIDATTLEVDGTLTIKAIPLEVTFPMTLADEDGVRVARGEFEVDRRHFELGLDSQATDEYVDYAVTIRFRFDIESGTPGGA